MRCPRCPAMLHHRPEARAVFTYECPAGDGEFVPGAQLHRALLPEALATFKATVGAAPEGPVACASCRGAMRAVTMSGVEVDACVACGGVWFDEDELARLAAQDGGETVIVQEKDRAFSALRLLFPYGFPPDARRLEKRE